MQTDKREITEKNGSIRILSRMDGKQSVFVAEGQWEYTEDGIQIRYSQERSRVTISWNRKSRIVQMRREGDVYLFLVFDCGKTCRGEIGLTEQTKGEVDVCTEQADVLFVNDGKKLGIKIILKYVLLFSETEMRRVTLQLFAEGKE